MQTQLGKKNEIAQWPLNNRGWQRSLLPDGLQRPTYQHNVLQDQTKLPLYEQTM